MCILSHLDLTAWSLVDWWCHDFVRNHEHHRIDLYKKPARVFYSITGHCHPRWNDKKNKLFRPRLYRLLCVPWTADQFVTILGSMNLNQKNKHYALYALTGDGTQTIHIRTNYYFASNIHTPELNIVQTWQSMDSPEGDDSDSFEYTAGARWTPTDSSDEDSPNTSLENANEFNQDRVKKLRMSLSPGKEEDKENMPPLENAITGMLFETGEDIIFDRIRDYKDYDWKGKNPSDWKFFPKPPPPPPYPPLPPPPPPEQPKPVIPIAIMALCDTPTDTLTFKLIPDENTWKYHTYALKNKMIAPLSMQPLDAITKSQINWLQAMTCMTDQVFWDPDTPCYWPLPVKGLTKLGFAALRNIMGYLAHYITPLIQLARTCKLMRSLFIRWHPDLYWIRILFTHNMIAIDSVHTGYFQWQAPIGKMEEENKSMYS